MKKTQYTIIIKNITINENITIEKTLEEKKVKKNGVIDIAKRISTAFKNRPITMLIWLLLNVAVSFLPATWGAWTAVAPVVVQLITAYMVINEE